MSVLKHPVVLVVGLLGATVYLLNHFTSHTIGILNNYFNNFLCMPLVLSLTLGLTRLLKTNETIYISWSGIVALTVYFSVHFEWVMPMISERYTADIWDVVLYATGALIFYGFQKRLF